MLHLRSFSLHPNRYPPQAPYPFCVPVIQLGTSLDFTSPVTLFVGDNGSGKSTLLEALGAAIGCVTIGGESVSTDPSMQPARNLAKYMKLVWNQRTRRGFFLRAEDFLNFARRMAAMKTEMQNELEAAEEKYKGRSTLTKSLAALPYANSISGLDRRYGAGLESQSHGESFFQLFQSRIVPNGLYLLDEPESPLSPLKQLSLLALVKDMVAENCQFIIATHSPILMALPGATILNFDTLPVRAVTYDSLEHVQFTRDFLNDPERFLRHL